MYRVKRTTKIWSIKCAYVQRMGGELQRGTASAKDYRFLSEGTRMDDELTVGDHQLRDGDTIEVIIDAVGC